MGNEFLDVYMNCSVGGWRLNYHMTYHSTNEHNININGGWISFSCFSFTVLLLLMLAHYHTVMAYWDFWIEQSHHNVIRNPCAFSTVTNINVCCEKGLFSCFKRYCWCFQKLEETSNLSVGWWTVTISMQETQMDFFFLNLTFCSGFDSSWM